MENLVLRSELVTPLPLLQTIFDSAGGKTPSNKWLHDLDAAYLLALDPGQTTGVAIWQPDGKILLQQWDTNNLGHSYVYLSNLVKGLAPARIFYEDYKVYEHKARDHVNNSLHTAQWIGGIQICAFMHATPVHCIMAQMAKSFWTDDKLKLCGIYSPGMRHARDALRHLLYHLTFPKS